MFHKCASFLKISTFTEKKTLRAGEQNQPHVLQARQEWKDNIPSLNPGCLIFVDETGVHQGMTRRYARAEGKARAFGDCPKSFRKNISVVGSLSLEGKITSMSIDGSINADVFATYVENILAPTLRPGDIVIMDNCSIHKNQRIRALIETQEAKLVFLPAYSPELNPIEECWSKFKTFLRTSAARTRDAIDEAITLAFQAITSDDARGWFAHSGYVT